MAVLRTIQTLLIPALIALTIFLLFTYIVRPILRRSRQRYHQYLPVDDLSSRASSLRHRASDAIIVLLMPSAATRARYRAFLDGRPGFLHRQESDDGYNDDDDDSGLFEEGEDMVGFAVDPRRREALEGRRSELEDGQPRLSRDLEQGFRDDSDEERPTPAPTSRPEVTQISS